MLWRCCNEACHLPLYRHGHGYYGRKLQSLLEDSLKQTAGCVAALRALQRGVFLQRRMCRRACVAEEWIGPELYCWPCEPPCSTILERTLLLSHLDTKRCRAEPAV